MKDSYDYDLNDTYNIQDPLDDNKIRRLRGKPYIRRILESDEMHYLE